jgi:hypothetical protein
MRALRLVALFMTEKKDRGVVCVFSIFNLIGVYVGAVVCIRTHTHTARMGYSDMSPGPGVGMRHLEGPKNPDGINLGIFVFVYVYKVHNGNSMYLLGGRIRS